MAKTSSLQGPWQNGPTELIELAITHLHKESDFEHRVAFLLLDVGVETLFKTYLTLPDKVTGTKMSYTKRAAAAQGSFHELIQGIEEATHHLTLSTALTHVQFYHELRNKLYHQGNGITIPTEKARTYAQIAVNLLHELLDVDLSSHLKRPEIEREARRRAEEQAAREARELKEMVDKVQKERRRLADAALAAIECYCEPLAMPSFRRQLEQLRDSFWEKFSYKQKDALGNIETHLSDHSISNLYEEMAGRIEKHLPRGSGFLYWLREWDWMFSDLTELDLAILDTDVDFPEIPDVIPDNLWLSIYMSSSKYPEGSQKRYREITSIDEEWDPEATLVPSTHTEIIQDGQYFVDELSALSDLLNRWTASQQSS